MKYKSVMVIIAVFLGIMAAYMIVLYTNGIKSKVAKEQESVKILIAQEDIPLGVGYKEIADGKRAVFKEVPKKYVNPKAITASTKLDGQVIAVPISKGGQVTTDHFKYNIKAGLAFAIPDDHLAISIPVDEVKGVSGMIKAGDLVTIIATFTNMRNSTGNTDMTKILLQNVKVIAVGDIIAPPKGRAEEGNSLTTKTKASPSQNVKQTITLSLSPEDAEKLVFAEEKGRVWLSLHKASDDEQVSTPGQTIESIFK